MRNRVCASRQRCFSSSGDLVPTVESLEGRLLMSATPAIVYSGPIVITSGGTYSGNWQSNNPNVAAVTISTTAPVIINNSNIQSMGNLIETGVSGVNLTVENTSGYGLNPGVAGDSPGRFVYAYQFSNMVIENDYLQSTSGINLVQHQGSGTVTITNNSALNIDGRISNGTGGWMTGNTEGTDWIWAQFVQLNNIYSLAGINIAWNQVINQPENSRVEDNISIYESSGTSSSPILLHDNYIQGAYNIDPTNTGSGWGYTGGGIMLGDGGTTTLSQASGYVQAYNNIVVSTTNYGIAIEAGHNETIYDNTIISSGLLPNGQTIADRNVGVIIWNLYGTSSGVFNNDSGYGNVIGWVGPGGTGNDSWTPDATSLTNNTDFSGAVTLSTEAAEWTFWQNKLATNQTSTVVNQASPGAPSNLQVTAGNGQVALSWTGSSGATSYNVYRGTTSGQEALLDSGVSGTSYTDSTAANGTTYFYEVTAVNSGGESGKSNEVSATPTAAVTAVTQVNLGGSFNLDGIVNDGSTFTLTTGIIDGGVAALSANLLGTSQTWNGTPFTIGAAGSSNVVSATGQTISLPAGQYASLQFLGLAVNGNQANQTFTVNYADGTTQTFTQSLSDWFSPQNYTGESKAVTMAYRDLSNGTKDNRTFYVYGYSFGLEAKTVSSITLPNDANVKLLSVTLSTATSV